MNSYARGLCSNFSNLSSIRLPDERQSAGGTGRAGNVRMPPRSDGLSGR